jgi:hypothetical protein
MAAPPAVRLADGRTINGDKFVASAIDFPTTVQMTGEELFPEPVREKAKSGTGATTAW